MQQTIHLLQSVLCGFLLALFSSGAASQTYFVPVPIALGELDPNSCQIRWTRTASRGDLLNLQDFVSCPAGKPGFSNRIVQVGYEGQTLFTIPAELHFPARLLAILENEPPESFSQIISTYLAEAQSREVALHAAEEAERVRAQAERALAAAQIRKRLNNAPVAILKFHPYDVSEHTDGTGITIRIANLSKKPIKYVSFRYLGLNAVNDPVRDGLGAAARGFRGIGPIAPNETATYEKDYAWMTDIVQFVRIVKLEIDYMDGSKRTVSQFDRLWISGTEADLLGLSD